MNKSRIQIAKPDILRYFNELPEKVFRQRDVAHHLSLERGFWRLTDRTTTADFITFLTQSASLSKIEFPFPSPYKREIRYTWGEVPFPIVALSVKRNCYFSHYSAVQMHGLTEQNPKTFYLNEEQRLESWLSGKLSQKSIDAAFARPVRVTKQIAETDEFRVCIINGKNTGNFGVIEQELATGGENKTDKIRLTNIERTLIDITVRPIYSGGLTEVQKAYELALGKVSVNKLAASLEKLAYIYPYHQAVGFYLERAGYKLSLLDLLRKFPMEFDFYLTHQMGDTQYVKDWRLFIPKDF